MAASTRDSPAGCALPGPVMVLIGAAARIPADQAPVRAELVAVGAVCRRQLDQRHVLEPVVG